MTHSLTIRRLALLGTVLGGTLGLTGGAAFAQTAAPAAPAAAPAPEAAAAPSTGINVGPLTFYGQIDGGVSFNSNKPNNNVNFGRTFDDKADGATLNSVILGVGKPIDPKATGFDWGAMVQFMYGSDARYTHFLGELDRATSDRNQFDILEADISLHLPFVTSGGIDAKIGQFPTPLGYEVIDPKGNPFYSHSYIFNYGLPFKQTGGYATLHATDVLDVWGGVDTGENTTFGTSGDQNGRAAFMGGFGLNMMDGNLTFLALTHIGPENPRPIPAKYNRYENDAYLTYKASDKLSFTTEANWIHDENLGGVDAYGVAQYASITLTDLTTLNLRGEVYRDNNGYFVSSFTAPLDFVNAELGARPAPTVFSFGRQTYGEITIGITYKPTIAPLNTVMLRPEIRYDQSLSGGHPFGNGSATQELTFAGDLILGF
jgi:hypothetical protein